MNEIFEYVSTHRYQVFSTFMVFLLMATVFYYELARCNDELQSRWIYDRATRVMQESNDLKRQQAGYEQVLDDLAREKRELRDHSLAVLEENEQLSLCLSMFVSRALSDFSEAGMHQPVDEAQPALPFDMPFNVVDHTAGDIPVYGFGTWDEQTQRFER